jgi:hypothetical protein
MPNLNRSHQGQLKLRGNHGVKMKSAAMTSDSSLVPKALLPSVNLNLFKIAADVVQDHSLLRAVAVFRRLA